MLSASDKQQLIASLSYVRLFLRKTSRWHRINRLEYYSDVADMNAAVKSLQMTRSLPESAIPDKTYPGELENPIKTSLGSAFSFADGSEDDINTLDEASSLLSLDELKDLAKEGKIQGKNKSQLVQALRRTSSRQRGWAGHDYGVPTPRRRLSPMWIQRIRMTQGLLTISRKLIRIETSTTCVKSWQVPGHVSGWQRLH